MHGSGSVVTGIDIERNWVFWSSSGSPDVSLIGEAEGADDGAADGAAEGADNGAEDGVEDGAEDATSITSIKDVGAGDGNAGIVRPKLKLGLMNPKLWLAGMLSATPM